MPRLLESGNAQVECHLYDEEALQPGAGAAGLGLSMRCGVEVAPVRARPDSMAPSRDAGAARTSRSRVEERRDGWARIVTAYGYPGWLRVEALGGGGELPPPRDGAIPSRRACLPRDCTSGAGMTTRGIDCSGLVHWRTAPWAGWCRATPTSRSRPDRDREDGGATRRPRHLRRGGELPRTWRSGSATAGSCTRRAATTGSAASRSRSRPSCERSGGGLSACDRRGPAVPASEPAKVVRVRRGSWIRLFEPVAPLRRAEVPRSKGPRG